MLYTRSLVLSTVVLSFSFSACSSYFPRLSSQLKGTSQAPISPPKEATNSKIMSQKSVKKTPIRRVIKTAEKKPAKKRITRPKISYLPRLNDVDTAKLYQKKYISAYVSEIVQGYKTFSEKPLKTIQSSVFRKAILSTSRGKALTSCQFLGLQIEIDGKKQTSDWLVTTKGKGKCNAKSGRPRYFWIIQQDKAAPADILLAGRADEVSVVGQPKKPHFKEISVSNSSYIKIKNGDKLTDGSWLQVKSSDNGRVFISCKNHFRLEGKHYQSYEGTVEASVNSAMMHGKSWQPVSNPRYRCHF